MTIMMMTAADAYDGLYYQRFIHCMFITFTLYLYYECEIYLEII